MTEKEFAEYDNELFADKSRRCTGYAGKGLCTSAGPGGCSYWRIGRKCKVVGDLKNQSRMKTKQEKGWKHNRPAT